MFCVAQQEGETISFERRAAWLQEAVREFLYRQCGTWGRDWTLPRIAFVSNCIACSSAYSRRQQQALSGERCVGLSGRWRESLPCVAVKQPDLGETRGAVERGVRSSREEQEQKRSGKRSRRRQRRRSGRCWERSRRRQGRRSGRRQLSEMFVSGSRALCASWVTGHFVLSTLGARIGYAHEPKALNHLVEGFRQQIASDSPAKMPPL